MFLREASPESAGFLAVANSPYLWVAAIGVFLVIAAQSVIYFRAARRAGPDAGLTPRDAGTSFRAGAIASIGPSLAVCLIAITLVSVFGTPAVLVRVGLIGSAGYEVAAAGIAANTQGATLGGGTFTPEVFATVLLALAIGGSMWMVVTLVATPLLTRGSVRLASGSGRRAAAMGVIPVAALLGALVTFGLQQVAAGWGTAIVTASSGLVMLVCLVLARQFGLSWLREWALGFALIIGIAVGVLISSSPLA